MPTRCQARQRPRGRLGCCHDDPDFPCLAGTKTLVFRSECFTSPTVSAARWSPLFEGLPRTPNAPVTFCSTPCRAAGPPRRPSCEEGRSVAQADGEPSRKRQRTSEDFISFCKFILEYENYESVKQEELRDKAASPSDSSADSVDSVKRDPEQGGS